MSAALPGADRRTADLLPGRDWLADDPPIDPRTGRPDYLAPPRRSSAVAVPEVVRPQGSPVVYRNAGNLALEQGSTVRGVIVPYGVWIEISNRREGHFMERFASGALSRSIAERIGKVRGYFEHSKDRALGSMVLFDVRELWEDHDAARFAGELVEGTPELLRNGLRRGLYGVSVGFRPVKVERRRRPGPSAHNPQGIEERTVKEAALREITITSAPAYPTGAVELRIHNVP